MNRLLGAIAASVVVGWFAWNLAHHDIPRAIHDRASAKLEQRVSWPAVRQGSTDNVVIALNHSMEAMPEGGEEASPAVEPLIEALRAAQDDATRGRIASALGKAGEKALPAVEPLTTALNVARD